MKGFYRSKIFWFDTETTGLDAKMHGIWQLSGIVEVDGEPKDRFTLSMSPQGQSADPEAINMAGVEFEEMCKFDSPKRALSKLKRKLERYVNRYDKEDKFVVAGYNVRFDVDFLRETFKRLDDPYYGSYFFSAPLDVMSFVALAAAKYGMRFHNFKLGTVCKTLGVKLDAHESASDIEATRTLYQALGGLR